MSVPSRGLRIEGQIYHQKMSSESLYLAFKLSIRTLNTFWIKIMSIRITLGLVSFNFLCFLDDELQKMNKEEPVFRTTSYKIEAKEWTETKVKQLNRKWTGTEGFSIIDSTLFCSFFSVTFNNNHPRSINNLRMSVIVNRKKLLRMKLTCIVIVS